MRSGCRLTLLNLTRNHQAAVVEMGMRAPGEIGRLAAIAAPTVAVVTNVGETHIELVGQYREYCRREGRAGGKPDGERCCGFKRRYAAGQGDAGQDSGSLRLVRF